MSSTGQQEDFQARLNRLNAGGAEAPDGLIAPVRREVQDVNLNGSILSNMLYPLSIVGAFLLGLIAVMMSRYARFHAMGLSDPETDLMLSVVADGALAFCIGFAIKEAFRLEGKELIAAQTAGVAVMVGTMHNLVWLWPKTFSSLFSPEWVDLTLTYSEFRTIRYMGYLFPF